MTRFGRVPFEEERDQILGSLGLDQEELLDLTVAAEERPILEWGTCDVPGEDLVLEATPKAGVVVQIDYTAGPYGELLIRLPQMDPGKYELALTRHDGVVIRRGKLTVL